MISSSQWNVSTSVFWAQRCAYDEGNEPQKFMFIILSIFEFLNFCYLYNLSCSAPNLNLTFVWPSQFYQTFILGMSKREELECWHVFLQKQPEDVLRKKVLLYISQNLQESTCAGVYFLLLKSDLDICNFLWIFRNISEHLFWRRPANSCFCFTVAREAVARRCSVKKVLLKIS